MAMRTLLIPLILLAGVTAAAAQTPAVQPTTLSRGHQILLGHGLQVQAQVFWQPTGTFDLKRWDASGFTTINWHWSRHGTLGGNLPWGRWASSVEDFKNIDRPTMVSFQLFDEQDLNDPAVRAAAARWFAAARPLHPNTLLFTNQAANRVTDEGMRAYLRQSKPDMLMFDLYPFEGGQYARIRPDGGSPTGLYSTMARYRRLALAGHDGRGVEPIPYGMYLQTFTFDQKQWRVPSESEIRLNQFAAWTFGYTFVSAFTYNKDSVDSPLESALFQGAGDARPTASFGHVAETNRQSRNLASALVRLISTDIRMIPGRSQRRLGGPNGLPEGVGHWKIGRVPYITDVRATNLGKANGGLRGDVLIGAFRPLHESFDGPLFNNEPYFMITNGLCDPVLGPTETRQRIRLDFDFVGTRITRLIRQSRETGRIEGIPLQHLGGTKYRLELDLPGGTGDLFKFGTGAKFVGQP